MGTPFGSPSVRYLGLVCAVPFCSPNQTGLYPFWDPCSVLFGQLVKWLLTQPGQLLTGHVEAKVGTQVQNGKPQPDGTRWEAVHSLFGSPLGWIQRKTRRKPLPFGGSILRQTQTCTSNLTSPPQGIAGDIANKKEMLTAKPEKTIPKGTKRRPLQNIYPLPMRSFTKGGRS